MSNKILSENMLVASKAIQAAINSDKMSADKRNAKKAQDYYEYNHDILNHRIFYIDDNGQLKEDKYASNVKIPHPFFTELVDQKVQYLLSNPVEVETEDEKLREHLKEYYTDDLHVTLQDMVEGSSIKAKEYLYARTTSQDILTFDVADSMGVFPVYEDDERKAVIRYYQDEIQRGDKVVKLTYAERWDDKAVTYFLTDDKGTMKFDDSKELNPKPHVIAIDEEDNVLSRSYGTIPFYQLDNNKLKKTDLEPIKALIDDYDLMNAFLSNNLHDFQDAIYVVKGFQGDDLSKLRQNIKAKKTVAVGSDGDVEIQTVNIPIEARKLKLEIDKDNIYKFGMGFDSTQIGDGNITNIVIKSRYALLDLKCNKTEARLKAMLSWMNQMIVEDINRRHNTAFSADQIEVYITRETMVNENDIVNNEKIEAETKKIIVESILAVAPIVDDETTLKMICDLYELDFDEVKARMEEQDFTPDLGTGTDPIETGTPVEPDEPTI